MNSVDFLLTNKDITYEIRTEIKRLGRPIPDLIISKTDCWVATKVHGLKKGINFKNSVLQLTEGSLLEALLGNPKDKIDNNEKSGIYEISCKE
ncbi:hypothetical protein NQ318_005607 [Aromia moschata]|uniref:Uncharacterized protein n=1 Tax=Aromia moschata TaxID=1265417 RepID=A0AAV8XU93_9CUCU|nr:hypothetical protein NQ318_005607 [Aromia moschata]